MTVKPDMYTERSLMLLKVETTEGVDALPTPELDAFFVGNANYTIDPTQLERDGYRPSFSPIPSKVGRKLVNFTFTHEIKGSGAPGVRSKLGTLLRGCGMSETLIAAGAATQISDPIPNGSITGPAITLAKDTAPTLRFGSYLVRIVTGGASGVAQAQITRWNESQSDLTVGNNTRNDAVANFSATTTLVMGGTDAAPTITVGGVVAEGDDLYAVILGETFVYRATAGDAASGTATDDVAAALAALIDADPKYTAAAVGSVITVGFASGASIVTLTSGVTQLDFGASGGQATISWVGDLVEGQEFIVNMYETGYTYEPISGNVGSETLTAYMYFDGQLHRITAARGSVSFSGDTGSYGQATFEFTGNFLDPDVEPLPTSPVYELSQPQQIELTQMSLRGDNDFCAQSFTINMANTVTPKDCMNAADGYNGSQITSRAPTAQLNPQSSYDVYSNMYGDFSRGEEIPIHLRVGTVLTNEVHFYMDRATYSGLNYGDRNGTRTQEPTWNLNGVSPAGDDELRIVFAE